MLTRSPLLPRRPVLDWASFRAMATPEVGSVERLPHALFTTSGRAAIYHALRQLDLPAGAHVLVPSYHCPTMVAPVLLAGFDVRYFGIRGDGLPNLESIDADAARTCKAMIVSHYFGMAQSLAEVRAWCDAHGVYLIEDCAHCYFGNAGDRPVGAWGDYSTASVSKFFPVPEAGLLASALRPIAAVALAAPGWRAQAKGWLDVLETAVAHDRVAGLNTALGAIFKAKNALRARATTASAEAPSSARPLAERYMHESDMARVDDAPLAASMFIKSALPRSRIVALRQRNFARYAAHFVGTRGARPLFALPASVTAPYVFPLWVDDAERVYRELTARQMPIFRWDRIWPGVPVLTDDVGPDWSEHVLQLLCHQDLHDRDIDRVAAAVLGLLPHAPVPAERYALQHA